MPRRKTGGEKKKGKGRKKKAKKVVIAKAKRKEAIAIAYIKEGKGEIKVNGRHVFSFTPIINDIAFEVLDLIPAEKFKKVDINVKVAGGGIMSQAQAVRGAIAKGIVEYYNDTALEKKLLEWDPKVIVDDVRRVEPKKDRRRKARAKFTKSYR